MIGDLLFGIGEPVTTFMKNRIISICWINTSDMTSCIQLHQVLDGTGDDIGTNLLVEISEIDEYDLLEDQRNV